MPRDNKYYMDRLKKEHPEDFEKLQKGLYRTPAEAFRATGLKKPRSRLQELKNAWDKATVADREAFMRISGLAPFTPSGATSSGLPFATGTRLNDWAKDRIQEIMLKRWMKPGGVMRELGLNPANPSLGLALHRGNSLQPDVLTKLENWVKANEKI